MSRSDFKLVKKCGKKPTTSGLQSMMTSIVSARDGSEVGTKDLLMDILVMNQSKCPSTHDSENGHCAQSMHNLTKVQSNNLASQLLAQRDERVFSDSIIQSSACSNSCKENLGCNN